MQKGRDWLLRCMQGNHPKFLTKAELRSARALASPCRRRSYRFGQVIKEAIESWPSEKRVAVFASGGMSHFVIDEEFDRKFVGALKSRDKDYLTSIPLKDLQSGTSELKSWISLAGLLEGASAEMHEIDYVPCYRSPAGTGTANGFYWWDMKGR